MRAEILFPEVCNLYGDLQNVYYLQRCCPALEIVETDLKSKPRFLEEDVTLVFMGSTTEQGLKLAADALRPYQEAIAARVDAGQLFLATGNALDILGDAIDSDAAPRIEGLGLLPTRAEYHMMQRHNSFFLGTFGIHHFYLAKPLRGVACLCFCWTLVPTFLGLRDGIRCYDMTTDEFYYACYLPKYRKF